MACVIQKTDGRTAVLDLESIQLQSNLIMINKPITQETVSEWQSMLLYLITQTTPEESKENPIQLYINSPGGSVYDGLGLYDVIHLIKSKGYIVRTINIGTCASMAAIILMAGSIGYRESLPNCSIMLHELSYGDFGKLSEMEDAVEESQRLQIILDGIITSNSNFLPTDFERKDVWMDAKTALKYKIIDKIL